jgi:heme exporter protein D
MTSLIITIVTTLKDLTQRLAILEDVAQQRNEIFTTFMDELQEL